VLCIVQILAPGRDGEGEQEVDMRFTKKPSMSPLRILPLTAIALAVAGCGTTSQSGTSGQPPPATGPATTASGPSTVTVTTPATPTATTSAPPSAPPPCRAADLSLAFLGGRGATGHGELGFALRNTSNHTCSTVGYPGIQFLAQSGSALPTSPRHTTADFFGSVPKVALTVAPGATVSFRLGVTHGMTSTAGCTTAYGLQVIPPNDTATLRTTITNGGAYECQTATVSPLANGTTAYP
jgi:hypothetical protein